MPPKNRKRKILIPKGVKLRKCSIRLGQIDKLLLSGMNSAKRKTYGRSATRPSLLGAPPAPGTKLIRVKSDLFKKTVSPLLGPSERLSKRTPKPNRRYVNDETLNTSTWHDKNAESENETSENDDASVVNNRRQKSPHTEPVRRLRTSVVAPKTVAGVVKKGQSEKVALTKRKIENDYDQKSASKQKKVSKTRAGFQFDGFWEFRATFCLCRFWEFSIVGIVFCASYLNDLLNTMRCSLSRNLYISGQ